MEALYKILCERFLVPQMWDAVSCLRFANDAHVLWTCEQPINQPACVKPTHSDTTVLTSHANKASY